MDEKRLYQRRNSCLFRRTKGVTSLRKASEEFEGQPQKRQTRRAQNDEPRKHCIGDKEPGFAEKNRVGREHVKLTQALHSRLFS